ALTASTHMVVASVPEEEEGSGPYPACSSSTMHGAASSSSHLDLVSVSDSEDGETTDDSAEVLDTLECCICWEDVDWEDTRALSPCNHRVCVTCLRNHATAMITEADIYGLTCPYSGCDTQLKVEQLQSILSTQLFDKLLRFSFIAAVKADELGKFCPHLECEWAGFVDKSKMISAKKVQCPDCKNYFCYDCDKTFAGHDDRTCEEAAKWLEERGLRDDVLDAQFKIWMLESGGTTNSRLCPSCKIPIQKDGGWYETRANNNNSLSPSVSFLSL
ncbi:MAG: IBR domain-containing protein, partial [archaeon]|nr:IBR domain-containing protein [archaeon]